MELCSFNHVEIVHEGNRCPICNQIQELHDEIKELRERNDALEEERERVQLIADRIKKAYPEFCI